MALILNIETATEVCSVALSNENGLIDLLENAEGKSHASLLTVFVEDLLKRNIISLSELDAIAISMGPGSYTGLRIGVSAAKGLCFGADKPLIAISTLQSMAVGIVSKESANTTLNDAWFCPMIDARRMEVYTAIFNRDGIPQVETKAMILDENTFEDILSQRKIIFFGNGAGKFSQINHHSNAVFFPSYQISASDMITISQQHFNRKQFEDVAYFEPFYLKDFVATVAKNKVIHPK